MQISLIYKLLTFINLCNTLTFRQLRKLLLLCCDIAALCSLCPPSSLFFACHWLSLMCVWIYKVHLLHFSFSSHQSYLLSGPCLFLFALDWLRASVCIPKQLKDAPANKEDYCLHFKKKGQPSLEVFPWMIRHTFELLVQWWRPFILHPRGKWKSATKGCRVSRAQEKLRTKSIVH